jgi:hypothetical protein
LAFLFAALSAMVATALDAIELADSTVLEGDFVGGSNGIIMFNAGDGIESYPEDEVVGVFFGSGVATDQGSSAAATALKVERVADGETLHGRV